jgi:hypothetical protein
VFFIFKLNNRTSVLVQKPTLMSLNPFIYINHCFYLYFLNMGYKPIYNKVLVVVGQVMWCRDSIKKFLWQVQCQFTNLVTSHLRCGKKLLVFSLVQAFCPYQNVLRRDHHVTRRQFTPAGGIRAACTAAKHLLKYYKMSML